MRHRLPVSRAVLLGPFSIQLPSEVDVTYKGTTIERTASGYWSAMVLVSDAMGEYYRPVVADTLHGIKGMIRDLVRG